MINLKKLKYLLILLLLIPIGVKASDTYYIAMEKDGEVEYYPYEITKVNHATYFAISPFENYEMKDKNYINNLAYASSFNSTIEYDAAIQIFIWQNIHPDYNFYLVDENYEIYDNSDYINRITNLLSNLDGEVPFKDATFKLKPGEELKLSSPINLNTYNINADILLDNYTISLQYEDLGTYVINFTNKDFQYYNGLINGTQFNYEPFKITIQVDNFIDVKINTYLNNELTSNNVLVCDIFENCQNVTEDTIRVKIGQYKFIDQITQEEVILNVNNNNNSVTFNHYQIFGIKTTMPIDKICQDSTCYPFSHQNDIYVFDKPITNGYYEIYTKGQKVTYNLNLLENYSKDDKYGLLYNISYEEEIHEDIKDNNDDIPEETISVNIPDTGIVITQIDKYDIPKRRLYF